MRVLALNCGSSSLKFRLFAVSTAEPQNGDLPREIEGLVKGIGGRATCRLSIAGASAQQEQCDLKDHVQAVEWMFERLAGRKIDAVGHRVVHGGETFVEAVRIDDGVLAEIERLAELAPLHNPVSAAGIRGAQKTLGKNVPMVAVFDTAFHRTIPDHAASYAIPLELAAKYRIRRYGFHGIAHASLLARLSAHVGKSPESLRVITLQLGHGCSAAAIAHGHSIDTSMGFTPLEGLMMGTRSGDLDPMIVSYIAKQEKMTAEDVDELLNGHSGLLGVSGQSGDMAVLLGASQRGDGRAKLAIDMFCYRVQKYIGAYLAALGGADAVVFGGGIGEHAAAIRDGICQGMAWCGLELDPARNARAVNLAAGDLASISREHATLPAYVAAVDEESAIARETISCLKRGTSWQ